MTHSIFSHQRHRLLFKLIIGFSIVCLANTSLLAAQKWPVTPYGTVHSGVQLTTDWSSSWNFQKKPIFGSKYSYLAQDKFYPTGVPVFTGIGALIDPSLLEGWVASLEVLYHGRVKLAPVPCFDQQGGFITAKCTFPQSEGVENFIGFGFGGLYLPKLLAEEEKSKKESKTKKTPEKQKNASGVVGAAINKVSFSTDLSFTVIGYMGRSWHLSNGHYLTLRGTYFMPTSEERKHSIMLTLGYYVYLI